jgi:hypothetical protein
LDGIEDGPVDTGFQSQKSVVPFKSKDEKEGFSMNSMSNLLIPCYFGLSICCIHVSIRIFRRIILKGIRGKEEIPCLDPRGKVLSKEEEPFNAFTEETFQSIVYSQSNLEMEGIT